jgi:hypothetical protein
VGGMWAMDVTSDLCITNRVVQAVLAFDAGVLRRVVDLCLKAERRSTTRLPTLKSCTGCCGVAQREGPQPPSPAGVTPRSERGDEQHPRPERVHAWSRGHRCPLCKRRGGLLPRYDDQMRTRTAM